MAAGCWAGSSGATRSPTWKTKSATPWRTSYFISRQREYLESELARRDALLREGRELAIAARVCEYPGERQALAERLRDWEQRVAELETDVF